MKFFESWAFVLFVLLMNLLIFLAIFKTSRAAPSPVPRTYTEDDVENMKRGLNECVIQLRKRK